MAPSYLAASRLLSLEVAWILPKFGADLNLTNKEGKIPFQLARECIMKENETKAICKLARTSSSQSSNVKGTAGLCVSIPTP